MYELPEDIVIRHPLTWKSIKQCEMKINSMAIDQTRMVMCKCRLSKRITLKTVGSNQPNLKRSGKIIYTIYEIFDFYIET